MPPRSLTLAIVAFWLATTSWLFSRDLKPRLWPAGPPPFTIDITDEAQGNARVLWDIIQNGDTRGYCETGLRYFPEDDTYELQCVTKLWRSGAVGTGTADWIIEDAYRVGREGRLRGLRFDISIREKIPFTTRTYELAAKGEGQVADRMFRPHLVLTAHDLARPNEQAEVPLDLQVPVDDDGSIITPLHPVNRLPNVRPGQRWTLPMIDLPAQTAREALKVLFGAQAEITAKNLASSVNLLHARVLSQPQILVWGEDKLEVPCLVIEYEGQDNDDIHLRTWVRQDNGLILQQEVKKGDQELILVRRYTR